MKTLFKLSLSVLAFLAFSISVNAQEINKEEITETAVMQAQKIGDQMELSEEQTNQLKTSIMNFHMSKARLEMSEPGSKGLSNLKRQIYSEFKTQTKSIVTPDRYAYFMKLYDSLN